MTEVTPGPVWMKALGAFLVSSFSGMVALTILLASQIGADLATLTMLPALLVLAVGMFMLTAAIRVTLSDHIELRFTPAWRWCVEYVDVSSVRVEEHSWYRFGGVGIRWRPGATGLLLGDRPALVVRTRSDHEYVVQCRDPERVADRIRERITARRGSPAPW